MTIRFQYTATPPKLGEILQVLFDTAITFQYWPILVHCSVWDLTLTFSIKAYTILLKGTMRNFSRHYANFVLWNINLFHRLILSVICNQNPQVLPITGTSLEGGIDSAINNRNTVSDSKTVMPRLTFSPESDGSTNPRTVIPEMSTQGITRLNT